MAKERHGRWEPPREFTAEAQELYAATEGQDHLATNEKRTAEKRESENRESKKAEVAKTETNYEGETQKNTEKHRKTQRNTERDTKGTNLHENTQRPIPKWGVGGVDRGARQEDANII